MLGVNNPGAFALGLFFELVRLQLKKNKKAQNFSRAFLCLANYVLRLKRIFSFGNGVVCYFASRFF
jgi:hypothetical protein